MQRAISIKDTTWELCSVW